MSESAGEWFIKYWHQILFALGIGVAAVKNHTDTKRVKQAVFDDTGDRRFVSKGDCHDCKDDRDRELQNIHDAISATNQEIKDMPLKIAEHLKNMGLLK